MTAPMDRAGVVRVMAGAWNGWNANDDAADILATLEAAGLRVVPVEATTKMKADGGVAYGRYESVRDAYDAMLAASPFAPPQPEDAG